MNMPTEIIEDNKGKRVELVFTDDLYTLLKSGDKGIYQNRYICRDDKGNLIQDVHNILWDNGSNLSLVNGKDLFKFVILTEKEMEKVSCGKC